ncbi:hypothetical protein GPJ59_13180, partial [Streptomyces bambusae]
MHLSRTHHRHAVGAAVCALLFALTAGPGGAQALALSSAGAGARDTSAACRSSAPRLDRTDEGSRCLSVSLRLSEVPALGGTARIDIEVGTAGRDTGVRLDVQLPAGLEWVTAPAGLHTATHPSLTPAHGGRVHRAEGAGRTGHDRPWRLSGSVRAVAQGPAGIRATATSTGDAEETDSDFVFLTVGVRQS